MGKRKEPTITIKDIATKCDIEVGVSLYYKICCRKLVSKYYNIYRSVLSPQGIELNDLKQDVLLMLWQILKENKKTKKIPLDKIGGYLFNSTKRQLNNIISKALTTHRRMVSLSVYNVDAIAVEPSDEIKLKSDIVLDILDKCKGNSLTDIIIEICTPKESLAVREYYFGNKNSVEIAKGMGVTKQRVSALIKQAKLKLKTYCDNKIEQVRSQNGKEDY